MKKVWPRDAVTGANSQSSTWDIHVLIHEVLESQPYTATNAQFFSSSLTQHYSDHPLFIASCKSFFTGILDSYSLFSP
jgi:hypothetical protein